MAHDGVQLNLARKWRSKQFDAVIGQELPVRILQNSLYVNQFFPVYLLSGQRGCGKTTTARLFAGAVNCHALADFQKNPKLHKIPCLVCPSCLAMSAGSHPDFVEIDAASHTGVDNIRTIIESASLLPALGRKKVYLIDEAHMLSKAAFNAFLKILEEPPVSVVFMLATTDPHKIIETVRSRCFQLFFTSIPTPAMVAHLRTVCDTEGISCDDTALYAIACETEGSARDALNLLEQVRFSHTRVTLDAVLKVLGHMPEQELFTLFDAIIQGDMHGVMQCVNADAFQGYVPLAVWKKSTELVRALLVSKQGIAVPHLFQDTALVTAYAQRVSVAVLVGWLQTLYTYESLLLKSTVARSILELLYLELCQKNESGSALQERPVTLKEPLLPQKKEQVLVSASHVQEVPITSVPVPAVAVLEPADERWQAFMAKAQELSDPLLQSIFKQAHFKEFVESSQEVVVVFARESTFFASWITDTKQLWEGFLKDAFGPDAVLKLSFEALKQEGAQSGKTVSVAPATTPERKITSAPTGAGTARPAQQSYRAATAPVKDTKKELAVDISDTQKWQKAHLLKEVFGGSVVEVPEDEKHDETEL